MKHGMPEEELYRIIEKAASPPGKVTRADLLAAEIALEIIDMRKRQYENHRKQTANQSD